LLRQLKKIVHEWKPDFLIPGDESTVLFLTQVHEWAVRRDEKMAVLLKRSLGNPPALQAAVSKHRTLEKARQLDIRCPASRAVSCGEDILTFARKFCFPILLKKSFSWAGAGVALCNDEPEALEVWEKWYYKLTWKRRFYEWRNSIRGRSLGSRWLPVDRTIEASQFIAGKPAMCLATAFEGRMLAALTAVKEKSFPNDHGPSSVVRFVCNEEMRRVAEKLIGAWGLSGFIGFDFILDAEQRAWLVECNPRPTPLGHLGARVEEDICLALYCRLVGQTPPPMKQSAGQLVAHFPQELQRDSASRYLTEAFHDVPVDDPELSQKLSLRLKIPQR
jgi:predicted ATP-grasp superfamily ATP-dependent carboligase